MMNKRIKKNLAKLLNNLGGYPKTDVHDFYLDKDGDETCYCHFTCLSTAIPAPTYDELIEWLEKEHAFSLGVIPYVYTLYNGFNFRYKAYVMRYYKDNNYVDNWNFDYVDDNKEDVYDFALNQMLTILLHEKENK